MLETYILDAYCHNGTRFCKIGSQQHPHTLHFNKCVFIVKMAKSF
jgi:hypothetical protein